jgi:hypothetical protein
MSKPPRPLARLQEVVGLHIRAHPYADPRALPYSGIRTFLNASRLRYIYIKKAHRPQTKRV